MEMVNPGSALMMTDETNVFTTMPTVTPVIEWIKVNPVFPLASLDDSNVIEFYIPGSSMEFLQLSRIKLVTEGQVRKSDGTALLAADAKKVGLASNIHHGQFCNLEVSVQEVVIQNTNNLFHHQTYIQQMINNDKQTIESELSISGFYLDTPGQFDNLDPAKNKAVKQRDALIKDGKTFTLTRTLMANIVDQHKLLIPSCSLRIKLMRNDQKHILVTAAGSETDYKYKLTAIKLLVPRVRLSSEATMAVENILRKSPGAKYQIERIANSYISIPSGASSAIYEGIYSGEFLPSSQASKQTRTV